MCYDDFKKLLLYQYFSIFLKIEIIKKIKDPNVSRSKYLSAIIHPKLNSNVWLNCESNKIFTKLLLSCSFPL